MTDKKLKAKILAYIDREQEGLMDANGNFEYPEHEGAYHILCNLDTYIDSLQEEPVSKDFTKALAECIHKAQCSVIDPLAHAEVWKEELVKLVKCEEPVSEECEEAADRYGESIESNYPNDMFDRGDISKAFEAGVEWGKSHKESVSEELGDYINELSKQFTEVSFAKLSRIAVRVAKWQKEHLWKPADGDDLPEIDREVIALEGIVDPTATDCLCGHKVIFAHRPATEGYDGKSITTGETEHYTPKTYGEGGWNIQNIVYWLDVELPKEIEL